MPINQLDALVIHPTAPRGAQRKNEMKTKSLTIKRENVEIFTVTSNFPYWSDGAHISARVALDKSGKLSAIRAQSIDAALGTKYLLVSPISFANAAVLSTAGGLRVGESETVAIE